MSEELKKQYIGIDIGRGFSKFWTTDKDGKPVLISLKSEYCIGESNTEYKNSTSIRYLDTDILVGLVAEKEGRPNRISKNEKYTDSVDKLIAAGISSIAWSEDIVIGIGIPNISYSQSEVEKTIKYYKDKEYSVYNKKLGKDIKFKISNVYCEREADAVLCSGDCTVREGIATGIVSIGFRTIEFSYYDEEFVFIANNSGSEEAGNITILKGVINSLNKDSSHAYNEYEVDSNNKTKKIVDLKEKFYETASEGLMDSITSKWNNADEMNIIVTGGTISYLKNMPNNLQVLANPIFASSKGLYKIAKGCDANENK